MAMLIFWRGIRERICALFKGDKANRNPNQKERGKLHKKLNLSSLLEKV